MRHLGFAVILVFVTFASPAWAADYTVTPICCNGWIVNGQTTPPLTLVRGQTYTFDVNAPGHSFWIKTAAVAMDGLDAVPGVGNNGVVTGTLTWTVPTDHTVVGSSLFYQCGVHQMMTGTILLVDPTPAMGRYGLLGLVLAVSLAGFLGLRRAGQAGAPKRSA
jgi:hypothetical protein